MFSEMRRKTRELSREDGEKMFRELSYGTLAIDGIDGYPYSLPINFVYGDGKIYFHGATAGKKYESLLKNNKVSLSVVAKDDVQPEKFTTLYKSAIAFGQVRILSEEKEVQKAMELILEKYSPGFMESGREYIASAWNQFHAFEISIEHMTAKSNVK